MALLQKKRAIKRVNAFEAEEIRDGAKKRWL